MTATRTSFVMSPPPEVSERMQQRTLHRYAVGRNVRHASGEYRARVITRQVFGDYALYEPDSLCAAFVLAHFAVYISAYPCKSYYTDVCKLPLSSAERPIH